MGTTTLTLEDAVKTTGNTAVVSTDNITDMTVVMTLDVTLLKTLLDGSPASSKGTALVTIIDTEKTSTYAGVNINEKDGDYGLWGFWKNENLTYKAMDDAVDVFSDLNGEAKGTGWDSVAYAGMTYTHYLNTSSNKSHTLAALTLYDAAGNELLVTYADAEGLGSRDFANCKFEFSNVVTASYYFDEAYTTKSDMQSLAREASGVLSIPEPTTATLSLLALAGLAVRRRRK